VRLELNSLGQPAERLAHRQALIAHLEAHAHLLDEEAKRRLHSNPLRILDTKNPAMQVVVEAAPKLMDFLGEASLAHLQGVRDVLDAAGLEYRINPRLVRGMDYYNLTVFEWVTDHLGSQGTVCGGGRYDGLFEQLGGKAAPAVGFGLGIERLLLLLQELRRCLRLEQVLTVANYHRCLYCWLVVVQFGVLLLMVVVLVVGRRWRRMRLVFVNHWNRFALGLGQQHVVVLWPLQMVLLVLMLQLLLFGKLTSRLFQRWITVATVQSHCRLGH